MKPEVKAFDQLLGEALAAFQAKLGVNDNNPNSASVSFFTANTQMIYRSTGAVLQVLKDLSVDRATGDLLKRLAVEEGVKLRKATPASDVVTISDTSFTKLASKIYAGAPAPNIGSTSIKVSNTTSWPSSGSIYIGRNTPNVEGPIAYSSIVPVGGYFQVNLVAPTVKFHNNSESVIVAQGGNRTVPGNTLVKAPSAGGAQDVVFSVNEQAILLDGEVELEGVRVTAQEVGTIGNVPRYAIKEFSPEPFTGASVTNKGPFKNARDEETDDELRARIKRAKLTRGLGSPLAIKNAVFGATAYDEAASVTSAEIVNSGEFTSLYADDGTGYERKTKGVGLEFIVDSALGGETNFKVSSGGRQTQTTKAFLISSNKEPYAIYGGERLAVKIGGDLSEHVFAVEDFAAPGAASAYELVASINSNYNLTYSAATSNNGTQITIFAKSEVNEDIQAVEPTTGTNASENIGFPSNEVQTLRLYKNNKPLSKNGRKASVISAQQADWDPSIVSGDTLILSVDGTANITYSITNADFTENSNFSTVSPTNELQAWVDVFNAKLTGVTASIQGQSIKLTSNLGINSRASVEISAASTLVAKGMFTLALGLTATGLESDFEFNRTTGDFKLSKPLAKGDSLAAGSNFSAARIFSTDIVGSTVSFLSNGSFWVLIDDVLASTISTGVVSGTEISISKPSANIIRYTSNIGTAFNNIQVGDYVINWSKEMNINNRLEGRVHAFTATTLDLLVTASEYASAVVQSNLAYQSGFVVLRTLEVPQRIKITAGTYNINTLADLLNQQLYGAVIKVEEDLRFILQTETLEADIGSILLVTMEDEATAIGFTIGDSDITKVNHIANYESASSLGDYPVFAHSSFTSESFASPNDSYLAAITSASNLDSLGYDPNMIIKLLHPYGSISDTQAAKEQTAQIDAMSGTLITLDENPYFKRIRNNDRFFAAYPFDFGAQDNLVVVLDNNPSERAFSIPMYRKATTNSTIAANSSSFNAYDTDSGPTASFSTFFGSGFKFDNYKVLMKAKYVIDTATAQDALLFRAAVWGKSGERYNVGYIYPTAPNQAISSTVVVGKDTEIRISLKSSSAVTTAADGTTRWNITITPNTPVAGVDQVTYTWSGLGSTPGLGALVGGEYVTIGKNSEFDLRNTGTYRVSTLGGFLPSATSFTIARKNGVAVAQTDVSSLTSGSVIFFLPDNTTAAEINTYIGTNLTNWVTSTIVDDGGLTGSGIISLSTGEATNFVNDSFYLKDGINWIASTSLGASPQFTWKRTLTYPTATGYAINGGEELRLIPTTAKQISQLTNVLAVSGISTLGAIAGSKKYRKIQVATSILGSDGAVQIAGGSASVLEAEVLSGSFVVNDYYTRSNISASQGVPFVSGQLVKLQASNYQSKATNFSTLTTARIFPNYPSAGKTILQVGNRQIDQRFFGYPRSVALINSRTWRVEKQGKLVCVSWTGVGANPIMTKAASFGSFTGSTLSAYRIFGTDSTEYKILGGSANFQEVNIGDRITISNLAYYGNNGDFLVTGRSTDSKTIRVLNPNGKSNYISATITITNNANITGDIFTFTNGVNTNTVTAGVDFVVGGSAAISATNLANAISILPGYSASALSNVVTIARVSDDSVYNLLYTDTAPTVGATITNFAGETISGGTLTTLLKLKEGDNVIINSPFDVLNQGSYRIIRTFNDSFYIENDRAVDEEIAVPSNNISHGGDGTSEYTFSAGEFVRVSYTGVGTEPTLGLAKRGDALTISGAGSNNGTFRVLKAQEKKQQITNIIVPQSSDITTGQYWLYNTPSTGYYVWYNKAGGGGDPLIGGRTAIPVAVGATDTVAQNLTATQLAMEAVVGITAALNNSTVRATNDAYGPAAQAVNGNMGSGFSASTYQLGQNTFIEYANASYATAGAATGITLSIDRQAINFSDYDSPVVGDKVVINGTFLGSSNQGTKLISEVLDNETVVFNVAMDLFDFALLGANSASLFVEESKKYSGYKVIYQVALEPANPEQTVLVFDTAEQAAKINNSGAVLITTLNKLNYPVVAKNGLDSYRYDIGMLAEINRIMYGDPRDSITYAGVAAAGSKIFTDPALIRRILVGIDVRVNTGIPFVQITEQIRNAVAALIKSNLIGQSIAISRIISVVDAIPGVKALAISSPQYDSANDVIVIQPNEKSIVINPETDILISQLGN